MSERDPEAVADWRAGLDHRDWLFDGHPIRGEAMLAAWNELDWTDAYVDLGPSVTGNPGPYWHVPRPSDDTVHRLYPKVLTGKWLLVIRRACEEVARSSRDAALEEAAKLAERKADVLHGAVHIAIHEEGLSRTALGLKHEHDRVVEVANEIGSLQTKSDAL